MSDHVTLYAFDAENGDCLLLVNNTSGFTILIDSGPSKKSVSDRLISDIEKILPNKHINLAIVTHNDDDHIGGFKRFIKSGFSIEKFIFNSHDYIEKILKLARDRKVSLRQDIALTSNIKQKIIELELGDNGYFKEIVIDVFKINFRSPNVEKLEKYKKWLVTERRKIRNIKVSKSTKFVSKDEAILFSSSDDYFQEDNREPNGSSLALDIEFGSHKLLLLGDSHPSTVIDSFDKEHKHSYDLVKVSHHGSHKNTNNALLSLLDCDEYLICSNADNLHGHPSPITLLRIMESNKSSTIHVTKSNSNMRRIDDEYGINFNYPHNNHLAFIYEF
ncbi:ComEC/Rec2 family competence protein [Photobacterium alginatilyticum]|uniref:Metallo-beta-lactamase domain-containing protein n=1 Tax=Photobacterium alginatilyticum TaxID=1775171 RepID=A0ABW9YQE5_9GAMM|nr:MBL fold metallo-hydrolase [Photobacterium alginatilyticum]NBI56107.1 hypothetical protein [Photobacterium alginatilyticum]